MRKTYITAALISLLVVLWLSSGLLGTSKPEPQPSLATQLAGSQAQRSNGRLTQVRIETIAAQPWQASISVRGRTQNKRSLDVRAETSGRLLARPVERGAAVKAGDLLCELALDDRQARVEEAAAALQQADVDFKASQQLAARGLQAEAAIAAAAARLAAAQAGLQRAELELSRREIRAPFAGLVESVHLETGAYVQPGALCVTLVDLHPMLLVGRVPERLVEQLQLQAQVRGRLLDGREVQGRLTFIGATSDSSTRTFAIEAEVPNPDYHLRSGLTAELRIPVAELLAHRIDPALLTLDDAGRIGVRVLDPQDLVQFQPVDVLDDANGQIWVTGLAPITRLITVGQELVVPGERVDPRPADSLRTPTAAGA